MCRSGTGSLRDDQAEPYYPAAMSSTPAVIKPDPPIAAHASTVNAPSPLAPGLAAEWMLDPQIDFLNHGSFGALPRRVAAAQDRYRAMIEARPIEILGRRCRELIAPARAAVSAFVGTQSEALGFVSNATGAVNAVLRAMELRPGDELLTTSHVYNAVRQTLRFVAERSGAVVVEATVPLPVASATAILDRVLERITARTRLVVIDHVTSPTALRFPVEAVIAACREREIDVLVDGAHAPGMLPLDLHSLGAAFYAANLHKWTCAPKGAAFLAVRADRAGAVHPPTVSHFLDQGFDREFDWQGTRDITAWLSVPDAIRFMDDGAIGLGWSRVTDHNHRLAVWVQQFLCNAWEVTPLSPLDGQLLGSMATVRLPEPLQPGRGAFDSFEALQLAIYEGHRIEVPVVEWGGAWHVRPCCQVYNRAEQYVRLSEAISTLARAARQRSR